MNDRKKKTGCLVAIVVILIVALSPGLIMVWYQFPISISRLAEVWSKGDTLAYFSAVLSLMGTLFLGGVTYWQTNKLHEQNRRDERVNTKRPFFSISRVYQKNQEEESPLPYEENGYVLTASEQTKVCIELVNCGDGPANNFVRHPLTAFGEMDPNDIPRRCVGKGECETITVVLKADRTEERCLRFQYENMIGVTYEQSLCLEVQGSSPPLELIEEGKEEPYYRLVIHPISAQTEAIKEKESNGKIYH